MSEGRGEAIGVNLSSWCLAISVCGCVGWLEVLSNRIEWEERDE